MKNSGRQGRPSPTTQALAGWRRFPKLPVSTLPRVGRLVLDLLFPPVCLGCGEEGALICSHCAGDLPRLDPPFCSSCGEPSRKEGLCARCASGPLSIDGIRSVFRMEGVVREAIHGLKYGNLRVLAQPLGRDLAAALPRLLPTLDRVVPVPLHPRRHRERGYNQAALLARVLAQEADLPLTEQCLERLTDTPPQARAADRQERLANVAGAFVCRGSIEGSRVLLVDDVCTTGATLAACAEALRGAGAVAVWGLTVAREV